MQVGLLGILGAIFLAIDAKKHGKNPVLWALLGLFFGSITLMVYYFKIERKGLGIFWLIFNIFVYGFVIWGYSTGHFAPPSA